jgi:hypothetical protein
MPVPTPDTVCATRRRLTRRVGRLEKADAVLAAMRGGAALHLTHSKQGPVWTLTTGKSVTNSIARLVITSASVVGVDDSLFEGVAGQTYRWWRDEEEQA